MLDAIIRFSLTQRLFVGIITLLLVALGMRAWLELPIDAFPDISPTQVKIILKAPGMTAEEVELQVTQPLETELLGIPNQQMLRSTTKYAITDITLDFREGTDIYWARAQVNERLAAIRDRLPAAISGGLAPMSTPLSEMFMFTVENPALSLERRRQLLDWEIRPLLRTVEGVADVNVLGGFARTYQVTPKLAELSAAGMDLEQLAAIIRASNVNVGAGRLVQGNDALIVRTEGRLDSLQELAALVVKSGAGGLYRLDQLAEVSLGSLARYGAVSRDGEETTEALIIALKDSNTARVVAGVKEKLEQIKPGLPPGTEINVFYDRSLLIDTAVGTISTALVQAIVLVILLLAFFLGDLRASIVVALSLPLAALSTFLLMERFGLTANLMSLGGLVIAIGMIVDSSVVVVENVVSGLAGNNNLPRVHLVYRATREVATPVVSGTLIVLIVFSPLLTLTGLEGKLFVPVAMTCVFAMFSALVLSLTVVPILASLIVTEQAAKVPAPVAWLQRHYLLSLESVFLRPAPAIGLALLLLLASCVLFLFVGKTFMPVLDEGDVIVQLEKSPSISLSASVELDRQVEMALLARVPEIEQIVARTGSDEIGLDPMGLNETDIFMELKPLADWRFGGKQQLLEAIREVLVDFPGISYGFTQPIQMRISEMLTGSSGDLAIKVFGDEIENLSRVAAEVAALVRHIPGSVDVQTSIIEGGRFLNIEPHPGVALGYGMSAGEFGRYVKAQLEGLPVAEIVQGRRRTPVMLAPPVEPGRRLGSVEDLRRQMVLLPDGELLALGQLARVSFAEGPLLVEREKGNRFAVVTTNVAGRDIVSFVAELDEAVSQNIALPVGYSVEFGGEFENQQRASRKLLLVIPVALLLILIILFTTFQSLPKAALILANIPFAIMGGVIALFVSGEYLSVPASVGLIALLGVAVLNAVVMVSHFEHIGNLPIPLAERIVQGAVRRLRPVLMTASTAMFGLLPLVYATGPGAEIQRPLAIVVIGGLFTSTITTLYLLPLFYCHLEKKS